MLQLPERLGLNLLDALTCHRELLTYLFKRVINVRANAEVHAQPTSLPVIAPQYRVLVCDRAMLKVHANVDLDQSKTRHRDDSLQT
jgi:hypothetical protein